MKYLFLKYIVVFSLVIFSGVMLMDVSHRVQKTERDIRKTERAIEQEQENIRVLRAEWAYLNDPARLERLATQGLGLSTPDDDALVSDVPYSSVFSSEDAPFPQEKPSKSPLYVETSIRIGGAQ